MATNNKNFKVKNGLEVAGEIGVGSTPSYGTTGQILSSQGAGNAAAWIDVAPAASYTSVLKHDVRLAESITKGQAVYISSSNGSNMVVSKASNASEATSSKTLGLLESSGSTNNQRNVVTEGLLGGIDVGAAAAGDPVWLGTSGNLIYGLTNKPIAPAHLVFIGIVTRDGNNGEIFVRVQNGFELNEIHNVLIGTDYTANSIPADNEFLAYNLGTNLWINQTAEEAGVANLSGATFTGNVAGTNISLSGNVNAVTVNATTLIGNTNASTITTGTIANARTTATDANGASTIVARSATGSFAGNIITATTFSGSGASLTSIPNSALVNNSITINGNAVALGGSVTVAGNSFETISANGTSVVADSSTDTLTITPGDGLSIAGNATSDTITFTPNVAGASANGIVTTGTQTFAGAKTFTSNVAGTNISMSGNVNATTVTATTFNGINNYIINGGFDFWQRGTSFTASGYTADRWYFVRTSLANVTRETANLPAGFTYALKANAPTSNDSVELQYAFERTSVIPLRGKTVTFSAYLKMDANMRSLGDFYFAPAYSPTTDDRVSVGSSIPGADPVILTKSSYADWARLTYTFVVPTDAVGLLIDFVPPLSDINQPVWWITGAQLEVGSVATEFKRAGSTYTEEQNACFRYYYRATAESAYGWFGQMHHPSSILGVMQITIPVNMRTIPSTLDSSAIGTFQYLGATGTLSSLSLSSDGSNSRQITVNVNGSSFGVNGSGFLRANNSATAFIGVTAEL